MEKSYVSEHYRKTLDDLAETLVTQRRFAIGRTAVEPNLDYLVDRVQDEMGARDDQMTLPIENGDA